jgi:hypothetical protein
MLQTWTNGKTLLRADHYFWILGGPVQKSTEGLLRAALHALLSGLSHSGVSENLETIKNVCESRWQSADKGRAWNCRELKDMLSRLALTSKVKIFLLIDALDECDPQDRLGDLADVILWLSRLPNVKLCASCRPWAAFTRRFNKATVLHLDQLTYHDMEVYIEKRLLSAETESDLSTDFHDGTLPAKQLIYDVANAANGVFLWVELVVNALCSEIRTGCSVDRLRLAISDFPTDLDDYFQRLIFGRIGTTRPNVQKTAAALKLAMVLKSQEVGLHEETWEFPMSKDYLNFWLLSVGQLKPGFSWTDQLGPRCPAFEAEKRFHQTKAFLEETCKDLLVMHKHEQSYNVDFFHRTVFDFLFDSSASLPIEKHAPGHFSDEGFAMDLLKSRCICRLREHGIGCTSSHGLLFSIFLFFVDKSSIEVHRPWLLACESFVLETFQTECDCLGLQHLNSSFFAEFCANQGLHKYLLETARDMPHGAISQSSGHGHDYLSMAIRTLQQAGTREESATGMLLLSQALEGGCDPNVVLRAYHSGGTCRHTKWEDWLRVQYLYSQHSRVARGDKTHQVIGAFKDVDCQRVRKNAAIINSLLRHGADPNCTPCTADHVSERNCSCSPTALHDILEFIVPAECLYPLQTLVIACSGEDRRNALRRNQRKRAVRSYIISEQKFATRVIDRCPRTPEENETEDWIESQNGEEEEDWTESRWEEWRDHQRSFLRSLVVPEDIVAECVAWRAKGIVTGLITWCVDCGSRSRACVSCPRPHSLTEDAGCTNVSNFRITQPEGHTTVAVLFDILTQKLEKSIWQWEIVHSVCLNTLNTAYKYLGFGPGELDLTPGAALSVLKEWYAKNPIEPVSLPRDYLRPMALPEELDLAGLSSDEPAADEASNSR